jgi:hypothetical protein
MTGYKQEVKSYFSSSFDTNGLGEYCKNLIDQGYHIHTMCGEGKSSFITIIVTKQTQLRNPLEDDVYRDSHNRTVIATKDGPKAIQG